MMPCIEFILRAQVADQRAKQDAFNAMIRAAYPEFYEEFTGQQIADY